MMKRSIASVYKQMGRAMPKKMPTGALTAINKAGKRTMTVRPMKPGVFASPAKTPIRKYLGKPAPSKRKTISPGPRASLGRKYLPKLKSSTGRWDEGKG